MNSKKGPGDSKIYQPLVNFEQKNEPVSTPNSTIIKGVIRSTVPEKDMRNCFQNKGLFMSIARNGVKKWKRRKKKGTEKKNYMSRKEKKSLNLLKCPREGWVYQDLIPLHEMWKSHIEDLLDLKNKRFKHDCSEKLENYSRIMSKADLHGAEVEVYKSKNPSLIGLNGICVCDNRDTFGIVTKENSLKTIPKINTVLKIIVNNLSIIVYGKYLMTRSAERSVKKIKSFILPVL